MKRDAGTRRYVNFWDWLFPRRHSSYWAQTAATLKPRFEYTEEKDAKAALEHVQAVAGTATERAEAADRRATTIAGTVAIAASFTLGGAGVVLDGQKFADQGDLRKAFAGVLVVTTIAFGASAAYALTALVRARYWRWPSPTDLEAVEGAAQRCNTRSKQLLDDFPFNWEVSVQKNHLVDKALGLLVIALVGIAVLAAIVFKAVS